MKIDPQNTFFVLVCLVLVEVYNEWLCSLNQENWISNNGQHKPLLGLKNNNLEKVWDLMSEDNGYLKFPR